MSKSVSWNGKADGGRLLIFYFLYVFGQRLEVRERPMGLNKILVKGNLTSSNVPFQGSSVCILQNPRFWYFGGGCKTAPPTATWFLQQRRKVVSNSVVIRESSLGRWPV